MAFGKILGKGAGKLVGGIVKFGADKAADFTGSSFIREVGEAAEQATIRTGELAGKAADGVGGTVRGVATGNNQMANDGLKEAGSAAADTVVGVARGVVAVVKDGGTVYTGLKTGDTVAAGAAARNIAKVAAVSILAVGVLEVIDVVDIGADGVDAADDVVVNSSVDAEPGTHFVEPHDVSSYVRADGTDVEGYWRDGDGNTSVDRTEEDGGGKLRSDPDGNPTNNLRSA